jgi:hypothetical protein
MRKRLIAVLCAGVVLGIVIFLGLVRHQVGDRATGLVGRPATEAGEARNLSDAKPTARPEAEPIPSDNDCLQLLGDVANRLAPETLPYLRRAIRSAGVAEAERRKYPRHSAGFALLGGLQKKLFIDDSAYAALVTGKLDRDQGAAVYSNVIQRLQQLGDSDLDRYGMKLR